MMNKKIAIIGCGAAVKKYYVPAIKRHPYLIDHLVLVDKDRSLAEELRNELGGGEVHEDYRSVIDQVQGAVIAVNHFAHYQIAMDFLNAGINVLCEKPISEFPFQARQMVEAAEAHHVKLCVNNTRRMYPSFIEVKNLIRTGRIGRLKSIEYVEGNKFSWQSATGFYVDPKVSSKGVLLDIGAHAIDTICWWIGGRPELTRYEDDSFGGPESVSRIIASWRGCKIYVILNRLCDLDNTYRIIGEEGVIEGKITECERFSIRIGEHEKLNNKVLKSSKKYPNFLAPIFDNFIQILNGGITPLIPGSDVIDSLDLIQECYDTRRRTELSFYNDIIVPGSVKTYNHMNREGKLLITGAAGFIGCRITEMIHLTGLREVRASVRQWSSAARLGRFPVDIVMMDILDREQIDKALDGVTEIIHCAYGNEEVTVEGTKNLLDTAMKHGVRRFVHLSTTEVYGMAQGIVDENSPIEYTGNNYNRIKIDAEKACWNYSMKNLPITIIRPSIVYGPFSRNWIMKYASMFIDSQGGIYENYGDGKCNLVYVDDLVWAILTALNNDNAVGEAFNVTGPEVMTWNEYFSLFNDMMGLPPLKIIRSDQARFKALIMEPARKLGRYVKEHLLGPVKLVAGYIELADKLMRNVERVVTATPSHEELKMFNRDVFYSSEKIKNRLGFEPSTSPSKGLETTVEWLIQQGMIHEGIDFRQGKNML